MGFRRNPLDLNNLPEEFARDHDELLLNDSSPSTPPGSNRKKKDGERDGSSSKKVYECRFCSLKFCKSQALGGHMNRHRQERETETLNRARQLVFGNDNIYQLSNQPMVNGGYHHQAAGCNMGSSLNPTRLFSGASTALLPPPHPHIHTSTLSIPYSSQYSSKSSESQSECGKEYYIKGQQVVCCSNPQLTLQNTSCTPAADGINNYTCIIGAPVGQAQESTLTGGSGH